MKKIITIFITLILIVNLTACTNTEKQASENVLKVVSRTSSIGGVEGDLKNFDRQKFSFTVTLLNNEKSEIYISWIEPILSEKFLQKAEKKENKIIVEKSILPDEYIKISGEIIFNAKGMTKKEILNLEPFIETIRVSSEKYFKWNYMDNK